jgi:hypothetical protein
MTPPGQRWRGLSARSRRDRTARRPMSRYVTSAEPLRAREIGASRGGSVHQPVGRGRLRCSAGRQWSCWPGGRLTALGRRKFTADQVSHVRGTVRRMLTGLDCEQADGVVLAIHEGTPTIRTYGDAPRAGLVLSRAARPRQGRAAPAGGGGASCAMRTSYPLGQCLEDVSCFPRFPGPSTGTCVRTGALSKRAVTANRESDVQPAGRRTEHLRLAACSRPAAQYTGSGTSAQPLGCWGAKGGVGPSTQGSPLTAWCSC